MRNSPVAAAAKKSGPSAVLLIGAALIWEAVRETFKHTLYSWASEGLGDEVGVHGPGDAVRLCLEHPVLLFLIACGAYCVWNIRKARLLSSPPASPQLYVSGGVDAIWRGSRTHGIGIWLRAACGAFGIGVLLLLAVFLYGLLKTFPKPKTVLAHAALPTEWALVRPYVEVEKRRETAKDPSLSDAYDSP